MFGHVREMYKQYKREIVKALDDVLEQIFGKNIKELLYAYLLEESNLDKKNYEDNLELFITRLEDFFGLKAANVIEKQVIKRLREQPKFKNIDENIPLIESMKRLKDLHAYTTQKKRIYLLKTRKNYPQDKQNRPTLIESIGKKK